MYLVPDSDAFVAVVAVAVVVVVVVADAEVSVAVVAVVEEGVAGVDSHPVYSPVKQSVI